MKPGRRVFVSGHFTRLRGASVSRFTRLRRPGSHSGGGQGFTFHTPSGRPGFHFRFRAFGGPRVSHFTRPRGGQGFTFHAPSGGPRVSHFTCPRGGQGFKFHASWGGQGFTFHALSGEPGFYNHAEPWGTGFHISGLQGFHISRAFEGPGFHILRAFRGARVSHFTRSRGGPGFFTFHALEGGPRPLPGPCGPLHISRALAAFPPGFTFHARSAPRFHISRQLRLPRFHISRPLRLL